MPRTQVFFDQDADEPPKLALDAEISVLGELITERGIEIQEVGADFVDDCPGLDPHNYDSEPPELSVGEPESKPRNGCGECMSEEMRRPPESEPLSRPESRLLGRSCVRGYYLRLGSIRLHHLMVVGEPGRSFRWSTYPKMSGLAKSTLFSSTLIT